jgi:hypothetical protein
MPLWSNFAKLTSTQPRIVSVAFIYSSAVAIYYFGFGFPVFIDTIEGTNEPPQYN